MKNSFRTLVLGAILLSCAGGQAWAQQRIATVDLRKIFDNYYKKKQADDVLKEKKEDLMKEDTKMKTELQKGSEEYQKLVASADDAVASPEERERRKKAATDKLKQLKQMDDELKQYEKQADTTLGEQASRMRSNIIGEIRNIVATKAKAGNFSLVLDTAAESGNLTPVVLFSSNDSDLTDSVLAALNATAPTELPKTDEKPLEKKDEKKKK
jgi:outer membrane protein